MKRRQAKSRRRGQNPDRKRTQTIDGATGKPIDTPCCGDATGEGKHRRIDLSTLRDVRLELAAVYRKMDAGDISSQEGTRRAYVLKTIGEVITVADFERRLEELESGRLALQANYPEQPRAH